MIWGVVFLTLSNLFSVYAPQIVRNAVDHADKVLNQGSDEVFTLFQGTFAQVAVPLSYQNIFVFLGILYIVVAIFKGFFLYLTRQTLIIASRRIEYDLKNEIYSHYQSLDLSFYKRNNTGDLMNRISEDVSRVRMYLGPAVMYFLNFIVLFVLVIVTMFLINAKLTLYVLLPLPLLSISIYYVSKLINQKSEIVQAQLSSLSTFVQESFSGIRVIKAFSIEGRKENEFNSEAEAYKDKNLNLVKVDALFMPLITLLIGLSTIITIYVGGKLALAGEVTNGNIAEFVIYVNMLTWPVAAVGWVTSITQRAAASQRRINEFLITKPLIYNANLETMSVQGSIAFRNVSFTYADSGIVALKDLSFEVAAGRSIAFVGKTGSGKSTVANLVARLFDASEGEILVDGIPLKSWNLDALRQAVGYVPQEVFLFSDSIKNNIAFGKMQDENDQHAIDDAAKMAEVYDNIIDFPEQFETRIGERGINLSGGQKQRVSIARAFMKNPKILILDDCLSAVDTETEDKILGHLSKLMKGKTSIIISHRISAVRNCDEIVVLDEGKVIERGDHKSLLLEGGWYKRMFEKQQLEEEKSLK